MRCLQAMLDFTAERGWLATTLNVVALIQMIVQARWVHDASSACLPHVDVAVAQRFRFLLVAIGDL